MYMHTTLHIFCKFGPGTKKSPEYIHNIFAIYIYIFLVLLHEFFRESRLQHFLFEEKCSMLKVISLLWYLAISTKPQVDIYCILTMPSSMSFFGDIATLIPHSLCSEVAQGPNAIFFHDPTVLAHDSAWPTRSFPGHSVLSSVPMEEQNLLPVAASLIVQKISCL